MNLDLSGKRAFVCGSSQGIGKAAAIELAKLGAEVVLIARNEEALKATVAELDNRMGQQHDYFSADFSNPDNVRSAVEKYLKEKSGAHILVNNTGGPPGGPITEATTDQFQSAFSAHLLCNHIMTTALLPDMKKHHYGRIINIISTSVKQPLKGLGVSNTIRAAVGNWSKTLSLEVASFGITVNNVLPGATKTLRLSSLLEAKANKTGKSVLDLEKEMLDEIPAGRFADPSEVAAAVAFLATPAASYINGINVPVDGGRTGCL